MGRRIYIIPKSMKVEDAVGDAKIANCPEIVHGIPPKLEGVVNESSLPLVFEEPEPEPTPVPRDPLIEIDSIISELNTIKTTLAIKSAEIDMLKARIEKLEEK